MMSEQQGQVARIRVTKAMVSGGRVRAEQDSRPRWYTVLSVACALTAGACGGLSVTDPPAASPGPPTPSTVDATPTEAVPAYVRCALDQGFRIVAVKPPLLPGDPPFFQLTSNLPAMDGARILADCRARFAPYHEKTIAELRIVYDRWVRERECLVSLGYAPALPPSFERFTASWQTGPWMPIDGVDPASWTPARLAEAKQKCTLEMYDRG